MEQINLLICSFWKIFAFLQCLTLGHKRFMCFCSYQGRLQVLLHSGWNRTVSGLRKEVSMYFYNMNLFCIYRKLVKYLYSASRALWIYGYQTFFAYKIFTWVCTCPEDIGSFYWELGTLFCNFAGYEMVQHVGRESGCFANDLLWKVWIISEWGLGYRTNHFLLHLNRQCISTCRLPTQHTQP